MTREGVKQLLPIMQAFSEGKIIEARTNPKSLQNTSIPNDWTEIKEIEYWTNTEYRIKPQSTYRPFKNAEECWQEMQKHQPFGWLKSKDNGEDCFVNLVAMDCDADFENMFDLRTFADGAPFGVKEE